LSEGTAATEGYVSDFSPGGLGLLLTSSVKPKIGQWTRLQYLDGNARGAEVYGEVRNVGFADQRPGWIRIGMAVRDVPRLGMLEGGGRVGVSKKRLVGVAISRELAASAIGSTTSALARRRGGAEVAINVVEYHNLAREHIREILQH